jgi:hypothetical protein
VLRFELTVRGANAVANRLRTAAARAGPEVQEASYRWAQETRGALKSTPYPAKRPQRYVRTGRLASSWAVDRRGRGDVVISNSRDYARYVVGDHKGDSQAWMHRGRWWTARSVIDAERPKLRAAIIEQVNRLLDA